MITKTSEAFEFDTIDDVVSDIAKGKLVIVTDDAVHFVVGFEHEPRERYARWRFTRWDLVDLSQFKVKLKAEFQGSNRDMYREEAIVASSEKQ